MREMNSINNTSYIVISTVLLQQLYSQQHTNTKTSYRS